MTDQELEDIPLDSPWGSPKAPLDLDSFFFFRFEEAVPDVVRKTACKKLCQSTFSAALNDKPVKMPRDSVSAGDWFQRFGIKKQNWWNSGLGFTNKSFFGSD